MPDLDLGPAPFRRLCSFTSCIPRAQRTVRCAAFSPNCSIRIGFGSLSSLKIVFVPFRAAANRQGRATKPWHRPGKRGVQPLTSPAAWPRRSCSSRNWTKTTSACEAAAHDWKPDEVAGSRDRSSTTWRSHAMRPRWQARHLGLAYKGHTGGELPPTHPQSRPIASGKGGSGQVITGAVVGDGAGPCAGFEGRVRNRFPAGLLLRRWPLCPACGRSC